MITLDIVEHLLQKRLMYLYIYFTLQAYKTDKRKSEVHGKLVITMLDLLYRLDFHKQEGLLKVKPSRYTVPVLSQFKLMGNRLSYNQDTWK